jgi:hypothetical protein
MERNEETRRTFVQKKAKKRGKEREKSNGRAQSAMKADLPFL